MRTNNIDKWVDLGQGRKAGRYIGILPASNFRSPLGYKAEAAFIKYHPLTKEAFSKAQWWIFLIPIGPATANQPSMPDDTRQD